MSKQLNYSSRLELLKKPTKPQHGAISDHHVTELLNIDVHSGGNSNLVEPRSACSSRNLDETRVVSRRIIIGEESVVHRLPPHP